MDFLVLFCVLFGVLHNTRSDKIGEYNPKYGTFVGKFITLHHDVTGDMYAVDNTTIHVRNFHYDGEAPDAYFFAGNRTPKPSNRGFIIPDEKGGTDPLGPYKNKNLVIKFPVTKKGQRSFHDIKWISIWCRKFAVDFGYVEIPSGLHIPSPTNGGTLESDDGVAESSNVIMEDVDTIVVKSLSYDGSVSDAIFVMGIGEKDTEGYQVPDEKGSVEPLSRYNRKTITLKLPKVSEDDHVQYFGIWSPSKGMISSVKFPSDMRVPPSEQTLR